MKSYGVTQSLALGFACLTGLSEAFATPENLAKLAERDGVVSRGLLSGLAELKQKAPLAINPRTQPIQGGMPSLLLSVKHLNLCMLTIYIAVDGIHEFQPPKDDDQRGPCPGLNALANHGYLPRSGVAGVSNNSP